MIRDRYNGGSAEHMSLQLGWLPVVGDGDVEQSRQLAAFLRSDFQFVLESRDFIGLVFAELK